MDCINGDICSLSNHRKRPSATNVSPEPNSIHLSFCMSRSLAKAISITKRYVDLMTASASRGLSVGCAALVNNWKVFDIQECSHRVMQDSLVIIDALLFVGKEGPNRVRTRPITRRRDYDQKRLV